MKLSKATIWKFKLTALTIIAVIFFVAGDLSTSAAINPMINFAGKVTNTDGSELADGVYDFSFSLYTVPTGGASIWSETLNAVNMFSADISAATVNADSITYDYTGASATTTLRVGQYLYNTDASEAALITDFDTAVGTVTVAGISPVWTAGESINNRPFVEGGVIDINLGAASNLSAVDFNQPLYLEIIFNGETMQPRKFMPANAQAFEAARLGGKDEAAFAGLAENETVTGEWSFNNILAITASSTSAALTVTQTGNGNIAEFKTATTTAFAVLADGRVQVGNYYFPTTHGAPGYVLKTDINGNMSWAMDIAGSGGGAGQWATSSDLTYGVYIYPSDTGNKLVIGNNILTGPAATIFEVEGSAWLDMVGISAQNQMRFYDQDSSNYFALRATSTLAGDFVLTLPATLGTAGQALLVNANGNLYWGAPTGFTYVNAGVTGQMPYYAADGSTLTATSSVYIGPNGNFGIGTTAPSQIFTVGGVNGNQFLVNANGQVVGGTWMGTTLAVQYGGTGTTTAGWTGIPFITAGAWSATSTLSAAYGGTGFNSYTAGDLLIAGSAGTLSKLGIGATGEMLVVSPAGIPSWVSTSSLNIDAGNMTGIIDTAHGGTGQNFSGATGFLYLAAGTAVASNTIAIIRTDLAASDGIILTSNQLSLDTSGNWSGTLDNRDGSYYLDAVNLNNFIIPFASALAGTTTSALAEGSNWYWTNQRFDTRLSATTSLPNITTLLNLSTVGTINSGTWNGSTITVAYGGTGSTTLATNGVLYGGGNAMLTTGQGAAGYILQSVAGVPTWVATSTLGINFGSLGGVLTVDQGGTGSTTLSGLLKGNGTSMVGTAVPGTDYLIPSSLFGLISSSSIGSYIQAYNLGLSAIAGLSTTTDLFMVANGTTWATQSTSTVRTTLGLTSAYDNATYFITTPGTSGNIWMSDGTGAGGWQATSTLNIDLANTTGILPIARGGTNWNSTGQTGLAYLTAGVWSATNTLSVIYGGTGSSTLTTNGLLYGGGSNLLTTGQGPVGYILQSVAGVPTWVATTSLGINLGSLGGILTVDQGGTGSTTLSGLLKGNGTSMVGTAIPGTDYLIPSSLSGLISSSSIGSYIQAYNLGLASIAGLSTTTDLFMVANGTTWATQGTSTVRTTLGLASAFDNAIYFITTSGNAGEVWMSDGNAAGTWVSTSSFIVDNDFIANGIMTRTGAGTYAASSTLSVLYGGTGSSTLTTNGLLYGGGSNLLTTGQGPVGYILQSVAGVPTWVATTSLGINLGSLGGILPIVQGGTGADNAPGARTNLGLAIGTDVQAYDLGLASIAGLATTTDLFMVANGTTWATQSTSTVRTTLGLTSAYDNATYFITTPGTNGNIWMSDGTGAGGWQATSTLGLLGSNVASSLGTNYLPRWNGSILVNSNIYDTGSFVGIGTTSPAYIMDVYGNSRIEGTLKIGAYTLPATDGAPGQLLRTNGSGVITWQFPDVSGGTGAAAGWATSTDDLYVYTANNRAMNRYTVVIGDDATSSAGYQLEVVGSSLLDNLTVDGNLTVTGNVDGYDISQYGQFFIASPGQYGQLWMSDGTASGTWMATGTLGLLDPSAIGSTVQGYDATLAALANFNTNGLILQTSQDTFTATTVLSVAYGGTGSSTLTTNGLLYGGGSNLLTTGQGPNGYILQSINGVPAWVSTSSLGIDFDSIGGVLAIAQGGTGATTAADARFNLGLDDTEKFGVNSTGTTGWLWQSDGDGRGHWVATTSLGIVSGGVSAYDTLVGTTTFTTDGSIATSSLIGYQAANYQCNYEFPGSHFCRTHEILYTIQLKDITGWGNDVSNAWIAEGPPGYTYDSNDCNGYTDALGTKLGAFWLFNSNGGGAGWLVNCAQVKTLSCCKVQ